MATESIDIGKFDAPGDEYILQTQPIKNVTAFVSFTDITTNVITGQRFFSKEFRYKKVGFPMSAWFPLTNPNLAAIVISPVDTISFQIKYIRQGAETQGSLRWKEFTFENITVSPRVKIRISKTVYDTVYGTQKFLDITTAITKLNEWSMENNGMSIYLQDDPTILDQKINIDNILLGTPQDVDFNVLLKTEFGKRFTKMFFDLDIDANKPKT